MKPGILWVSQVVFACRLATLAHGQAPETTGEKQFDRLIESGLLREYGESSSNRRKIAFQKKTAILGDRASGVEVAKTNNVVAIDITPCAESRIIVRFEKPFKETAVGLIRCANGYHHQVLVIQQ
jgi:hypothetical protein